jgi:hypothetical protein
MFTTSGEFQYFGCKISYESEIDIQQQMAKFSQLQKYLNVYLKQLGLEMLKNKIYNTLDVRILLYGREIWALKKKDEKQLTSFEITFFRRTVGYNLFDYKTNEKLWKG